jgi:predicted ATP-grasp superfamily ATP-dependent carboligase
MRHLWGNGPPVLAAARSPRVLQQLLSAAGLPCPALSFSADGASRKICWLAKPLQGAGGRGIRFWDGQPLTRRSNRRIYLQEFIEGATCAAIYSGAGANTRLLGVSRQLVGESWLHAAAFHYCGSIGPLVLTSALRADLERLGIILACGCGLRGLFGVDCVLRDGIPWPLEVNPRYTASVEVLEFAGQFSAMAWQRYALDLTAPEPAPISMDTSLRLVGKCILFAKSPLTFPEEGPWLSTLSSPGSLHEPPQFADIPPAGQPIAAGRPILTLFVCANTPEACLNALQRAATDLDQWLFGR